MAIRRPPFPQNPQGGPQPVAPIFPTGPRPSIGMVHRPRKDLLQWLRRKKGGIGGLRRKLLEGRQFPTGIPEQFRQLPFGPPSMGRILPNFGMKQKPMVPWDPPQGWRGETVMPMPMQPLPEEMPMQPIPRLPEDMMMYPGGTPGFYDDGRNFSNFDFDLPRPPSPEEITQQRIDQVSQFEQEPMMGARHGDIGGYADTGMRADSGRPYALPGGYAGGGIADLISYYGR